MKSNLWFGPNRIALQQEGPAFKCQDELNFPYLGIIPRGIFNRLPSGNHEHQPAQEWAVIAPWLECALVAGSEQAQSIFEVVHASISDRTDQWLDAARDAGVLSLVDSARVGVQFIERQLDNILKAITKQVDPLTTCVDLWCIKEGHTSSVWKLEIQSESEIIARLCMNIARDEDASLELAASFRMLTNWFEVIPDHVSRPILMERIPFTHDDVTHDVTVTVHEWIDGYELHTFPKNDSNEAIFVAVETFLPEVSPSENRLSFVGYRLSPEEQETIWTELIKFLRQTAIEQYYTSEILVPVIDVNEGDMMWTGSHLVVVASSDYLASFSIQAWQSFLDNPYIRQHANSSRLYRLPFTDPT